MHTTFHTHYYYCFSQFFFGSFEMQTWRDFNIITFMKCKIARLTDNLIWLSMVNFFFLFLLIHHSKQSFSVATTPILSHSTNICLHIDCIPRKQTINAIHSSCLDYHAKCKSMEISMQRNEMQNQKKIIVSHDLHSEFFPYFWYIAKASCL